jgi:Uncharacterized protein conserved in bacteria
MNGTKKLLYIILGTVFLVLGTIGLFLPLLPTTPFWLLTCWFYIRSSEKLYNKALSNDVFGSYVKGFLVDRSITLRSKIVSISVMWISTIISVIIVGNVWIGIIIMIVNILVTLHILSFPTRKSQ